MLIIDTVSIIIFIISLIAVIAGSITDFQRREVPDWINYGLIISGLGVRIIFSIYFWDYSYIADGLFGLGIIFLIALALFYTGQWGGGDSKMLMGLSAIIGIPFTLNYIQIFYSPMIMFIFNLMIIGGIYGALWSIGLLILNLKSVILEIKLNLKKTLIARYISLGISGIIIVLGFLFKTFRIPLIVLGLSIIALYYIWIGIKALEKVSMVKKVSIEKITEGDWIAEEVIIDNKYICGPNDLGISKKQIHKLIKLKDKEKISHVTIKEGIPFVPSFLIALMYTIIWGNNLFITIFDIISQNI